MRLLFYLSQNVQVPTSHTNQGLVTQTKQSDGQAFNWQDTPAGSRFIVHHSEREPQDEAVSVSYRGHYFYLKDSDLESKSTFMLLMQLYAFQAGESKIQGPTLTLPLGT